MTDGATLGITGNQAVRAILAGDSITPEMLRSPEEVRERVLAAYRDPGRVPDGASGESYSHGCDVLAGAILQLFRRHPEAREWGEREVIATLVLEESEPVLEVYYNCTGFMWGFALNQARWISDLEPLPNPALLYITEPE